MALLVALALACAAAAAPAQRTGLAGQHGCAPRFLVAIDVGHAPSRPGARSARGADEFDFNARLADALQQALDRRGIAARQLRDVASDRHRGAEIALDERAPAAAALGASVLLSLHHDSVQPRYMRRWRHDGAQRTYSDRFRGFSLFVSGSRAHAADSLALARRIGERLRAAGRQPTRHHAEPIPGEGRELIDAALGIYRYDELVVLRTASIPAVLIEAGVIVHRAEERDLARPRTRQRIAAAIADAIAHACAALPSARSTGPSAGDGSAARVDGAGTTRRTDVDRAR